MALSVLNTASLRDFVEDEINSEIESGSLTIECSLDSYIEHIILDEELMLQYWERMKFRYSSMEEENRIRVFQKDEEELEVSYVIT